MDYILDTRYVGFVQTLVNSIFIITLLISPLKILHQYTHLYIDSEDKLH